MSSNDLALARALLAQAGAKRVREAWVDFDVAVDLHVDGLVAPAVRATLESGLPGLDIIVQPEEGRRPKRLLVADMDSTIIGQECIDELADFAGRKAEIAAITEAAMRGELDFAQALAARVAALAGLATGAIQQTLAERVHLNPGARTLVATMKAHGARCVLVSGGFTVFTEPVAAMAGFDRQVANRLEISGGRLLGTVRQPIIDSATKRATLLGECKHVGIGPEDALAIGDGANDIPMLEAAGLGIAYRAKPKAAAAADGHVRHGDLTAILLAQGIARSRWVMA
ncbi:phosphoserine phosphatase SerB [Thermaurantiacus sp.]